MREFPYRHPWLFSLPAALCLALLPIVAPHPNNHHPVQTAIGIAFGTLVIMRALIALTPGARERRKQGRQ
jgi:hypothetical protein